MATKEEETEAMNAFSNLTELQEEHKAKEAKKKAKPKKKEKQKKTAYDVFKPKYVTEYLWEGAKSYPAPEQCFAVNEEGKFVKQKKPEDHQDIAMFWQTKQRTLGMVMLLSAMLLLAIILYVSTERIDVIYNLVAGGAGWIIDLTINTFLGWTGLGGAPVV